MRGTHHARTDDASTTADLVAAAPCRAAPRRSAGRVAPRRRRHSPLYLSRPGGARAPPGQRAARARRDARHDGGHAGLEWLPAHGAVLRGLRVGQRAAHAQSAAARRPAGVDRHARAGPCPLLRPELPAAHRTDRRKAPGGARVRADERPRAHAAADWHREPAVLRGADRGRRRLRMAGVRREHRLVAVLHERHDGRSQGRALQPSIDAAAHLRRRAARFAGLKRAGGRVARRPDVPCERLGSALRGLHGRREDRLPRPAARRQVALRAVRGRRRHAVLGRADGLAGAARPRRTARPALFHDEAHGDRRRRLSAGDAARLRPAPRRRRRARLGHDRDEPVRHGRGAQGRAARARRGGALRRAGEAGALRVRHRPEGRRRQRYRTALGRQLRREPDGARTVGARALLQGAA
ncbi:hypothetical protein D3C72_1290430 [compost metagenome]